MTSRTTALCESPNPKCRRFGHDFDVARPSVFSPEYVPPAEPVVSTCQRCGVTRTDLPDGSRHYSLSNP